MLILLYVFPCTVELPFNVPKFKAGASVLNFYSFSNLW